VRIVVDTNVIVSAFLWGGTPRRILDAVEAQRVELFTSRALIAELEDVLSREKFAALLRRSRFTSAFLLSRYTQLATLLTPVEITVAELRDPDDAHILACALAARAEAIVSGDADLHALGSYQGIAVLSPADCVKRFAT
jgi:putative PIN family toxin of toxin-antitoxin system